MPAGRAAAMASIRGFWQLFRSYLGRYSPGKGLLTGRMRLGTPLARMVNLLTLF